MDSSPRVVQSQVNENDEHHPHNVGSQQVTYGAEEHNYDHEKKSVLNKVKAKARKIKETIKKHGHHVLDHGREYNNEDQHIPEDHDLDEDEEMEEDQEVHEAPIHESETVRSATTPSEQVENLGKSGVNLGGTAVKGEEPHQEPRVVGVSPTTEVNQNIATDPAKTFVGEGKPGQPEVNLEEDPHVPGSRPEAYTPPNYQTKVTDPTGTGTAEIDITPVEKSFARMNVHVHDEPKLSTKPEILPNVAETQYPSAGSHNQFVPDLSTATTKTQQPFAESHDQYMPEELSSATKTQYPSAGSHEQFVPDLSSATTTQYPSAGSHDLFAPETISTSTNKYPENSEATGQTFNTTTTKVEEQPSHESVEKSSNQSSHTDKISSATSVIADKAVSAENAVASELGYGEKGDKEDIVTIHEEQKKSGDASSNKSGSTTEYGKNIAHSLTEKLSPVYEKVAGLGSSVKSKVSGTKTGANTGVGTEVENGVKEQDKGVSVKEYLAEKLRPGEEDKALSEVISEALHKRKEEPTKASGDVISDDIHKKEEVPVEKEHGQLGSGNEKTEKVHEQSNVNSPGKGVVDKLKGAVGSWFGKSGENQSSQVAGGEDLSKNKNSDAEAEQVSQAEAERRLQE